MAPDTTYVLLIIGLLEVKHFVCDFVFQTLEHVRCKGIYGNPKGIEHSAIHALGTIPALLIPGTAWTLVAIVVAIEFVIHYHTDWTKEQIGRRAGWTPADHYFWIAIGADQLVHQLTYVGIAAALVVAR